MTALLPFSAVVNVNFVFIVVLAQTTLWAAASSAANRSQTPLLRSGRQTRCKPLEFRCNNGQCTQSYNVCDGSRDCSDGSDETRTACRALNIVCPSLSFECAYGACIDKELRCNGRTDCADGSDEQGCPNPSPRPAVDNPCGAGKFHCSNGECISTYDQCDGATDCSDGSDETSQLCEDLMCPSNGFKCDYGACLEESLRCNGVRNCHDGSDERGCPNNPPVDNNSDGCLLPEHPTNGVYTSALCQSGDLRPACRNSPGTLTPSKWLLKYTCNENYDLTSVDSEYSVCEGGVWKNPLDCIKLCQPLKSLSVDVKCVYNGREVSCNKPMKPNTTATARCKQHYREIYKPEYSSLLCLDNGEWSYRLFYCTPDCGASSKSLVSLILHGRKTRQGEYPWLAALYQRNASRHWEQACAGTLITPHIVLTAAHCLVLDDGTLDPRDIKVGLGKYHRDFYKDENYSVIADVRELVTPRYYSGGATFYALDIGLLDLTVSVQVTAYIMPACVDWSSSITIGPGSVGHVAGWGTTENRTSSETIISAELLYIDNAECIRKVRRAYTKLVTHDKFCAGSVNGSQVDKGDSGGGLTFVKGGQHFVFGVVSTKIIEETTFSLFTDISNAEHHVWLDEHRTRLDRQHKET